jgi:uncharacterized protein YndB with AHSA1/START domain
MNTQVTTTMYHDDKETGAVVVEDVFGTDQADLWNALTSPERLRRWIADVAGDLRVGGSFTARFTSGWEGTGQVVACEEPTRLEVTTQADGETTTIEARVTPAPGGTRLVIEERGLARGQLHFYGAGWQTHLEDLGASLRGEEPAPWQPRWAELVPAFESAAIQARR